MTSRLTSSIGWGGFSGRCPGLVCGTPSGCRNGQRGCDSGGSKHHSVASCSNAPKVHRILAKGIALETRSNRTTSPEGALHLRPRSVSMRMSPVWPAPYRARRSGGVGFRGVSPGLVCGTPSGCGNVRRGCDSFLSLAFGRRRLRIHLDLLRRSDRVLGFSLLDDRNDSPFVRRIAIRYDLCGCPAAALNQRGSRRA